MACEGLVGEKDKPKNTGQSACATSCIKEKGLEDVDGAGGE